jgi:hypothetical protein
METDLKIAFRNAWLLWFVAVAFIVLFFAFVIYFSYHAPREGWDMGGKRFVPAQSDEGEGYYLPVTAPKTRGEQ